MAFLLSEKEARLFQDRLFSFTKLHLSWNGVGEGGRKLNEDPTDLKGANRAKRSKCREIEKSRRCRPGKVKTPCSPFL